VRLRIEGRVQGVGFRAFVVGEAAALGLSGWVRNRRDGGVEASLHGASAAVESMIECCRNGPPGAHVAFLKVLADDGEPPAGFEVWPTI
jgi:acylphosphatase